MSLLSSLQDEPNCGKCSSCNALRPSSRPELPSLQLCKYIGKLRLLERGLLEAAQGIDHLTSKKKMQRGSGKADEEEMADVDDFVDDESEKEYMTRINLYVHAHLSRVPAIKRDQYKDVMVYEARKVLFHSFFKDTALKKCQNEGCHSYVLVPCALLSER